MKNPVHVQNVRRYKSSITMNGKTVKKYIKELGHEPRHDVDALAYAFNTLAEEENCDAFALMKLMLDDWPIPELYTHSYGFHTSNGRELIESMEAYYYNYEGSLE